MTNYDNFYNLNADAFSGGIVSGGEIKADPVLSGEAAQVAPKEIADAKSITSEPEKITDSMIKNIEPKKKPQQTKTSGDSVKSGKILGLDKKVFFIIVGGVVLLIITAIIIRKKINKK